MQPVIVFVSPVIPAFTGGGSAMRAACNLRALAGSFQVHLLVIPIYGGAEGEPSADVLRYCCDWRRVAVRDPLGDYGWWDRLGQRIRWRMWRLPPEWNGWEARTHAEVREYLEGLQPVRVWVFRFYLLPWMRSWMKKGGKVWLDVDECESRSRARQAALSERLGNVRQARALRVAANAYRRLESVFFNKLDGVVAASQKEADFVEASGRNAVHVWPNIISLEPVMEDEVGRPDDGSFRLLFVGSMGHFPNRDAVAYAAREILPRLKDTVKKPVTLCVAGAGCHVHHRDLEWPGVDCLGEVRDLAPLYAASDLVLVPLRAGAGTRIKILEAFAYGKAVVSTSVGAEGLDVRDGVELILADTAEEIASACAKLLMEAEERQCLGRAGKKYLVGRHDPGVLSTLAAGLAANLPQA